MTVPSPWSEVERELETLRRRAYGPDADIAADPEAASRLDRLERTARVMSTPSGATGAFHTEPASYLRRTPPATHQTSEPEAPSYPRAASHPWWRNHPIWVAVATVAASAAVAMGIAYVAAGPRPDVTLALTGETPADALTGNLLWLESTYDIERDSILGHDEFAEMSVWTARTETGGRCLFLTAGDAYELATSCMPSDLDPTIDFTVYRGMTELVGGDLPDGTALRFVHHGDTVDVWVRPPRVQ